MPIRKDWGLLFKEMRHFIDFAYANCHVNELAEELNLKLLKSRDVRVELDEVMARIDELNAPVVLCHNDFRGSNMLVTELPGKI